MRLTRENAAQYEGKLLDCSKKLFHYYPLKVVNHPTMGWMYVDRFHVMMRIPEEGVFFESILEVSNQ